MHSLAETTTTMTPEGRRRLQGRRWVAVACTHFHLVMSGPRTVQCLSRRPQVVHTQLLDFFSCSPGLWLCQRQMLPAQRAERADRCPHWPRDTSRTSSAAAADASSSSSPSSPSLSGLHQLRFAGQQRQRHNRCPFRYVFCALCGLRLCCFFWGQSSVASAGLLIYL